MSLMAPPETAFDPTARVSYSSLSTHRECPQKWAYKYLSGLEVVNDSSVYSDLGTWWHAVRAADSIHRGVGHGSLRLAPSKIKMIDDALELHAVPGDVLDLYRVNETARVFNVNSNLILGLAALWWKKATPDQVEEWTANVGGTLPDRLAYMDAQWRIRWAADLDNEHPLAVELKFSRPLPNSSSELKGYVDEVYLDNRRKLVVARDFKSNKAIPAAEALDDLTDSQLHLYSWGAEPTLAGLGVGPVQALSYDRARSVAPKSPAITAAGNLSKSITDYDLATYLAFVGEGVEWGVPDTFVQSGARKGEPKFGVYTAEADMIEKLSSESARSIWQQRTLVPVNPHAIRAHLAAAEDSVEDMVRNKDRYERVGNAPRNLTRKGCGWCPFNMLCRAQLLGGNEGHFDIAEMGLTIRNRADNR